MHFHHQWDPIYGNANVNRKLIFYVEKHPHLPGIISAGFKFSCLQLTCAKVIGPYTQG